mmetsp:Transcript_19191/g.34141  ORF Transcript_19191/g.34141 Transcript_19191/m.34141 type:complete len:136 (+) Transcript_19191:221-628(+)
MDHDEFVHGAKEYISLKERIATIAAEARDKKGEFKDRVVSLEDGIKTFLVDAGVDVCVVGDYNLKVATTTKKGSFTRKTVRAALVEYMGSEEEADRVMDHIEESVGHEEITVLRKTKRRGTGEESATTLRGPIDE